MPIRASDLNTNLLHASGDMPAGVALQTLLARPVPHDWLLLINTANGYAVLSLNDLFDAKVTHDDQRLLSEIARMIPTGIADIGDELADLQGQLGFDPDQYFSIVVLHDEKPLGALALQGPNVLNPLEMLLTPATTVAPLQPVKRPSNRYVNTDFTSSETPEQPLGKQVALQPGQRYFFRLNVGELELTTIESSPATLPEQLLNQAIDLTIVLFSETFMLEQAIGVLHVPESGAASVLTPATLPVGLEDSELARTRLLFGVRTPEQPGYAELRVGMYYNGMLIQSRLVTVVIGDAPALEGQQLRRSVLDFNLSPRLAASHLSSIAEHRLSLLLNSNSDGTHSFRLVGNQNQELFAASTTFEPTALADLITQIRGVLQQAAWGENKPYTPQMEYRYQAQRGISQLRQQLYSDLLDLAARGAKLYGALKNELGQGKAGAKTLRALMREPGMIQMASKVSASHVVPIALFYDYACDTGNPDLKICQAFVHNLESGKRLIDTPCFQGHCPSHSGDSEDSTVICPGGFWGFRHDIGMPYAPRYGPEMAQAITYSDQPQISVAYFQFPELGAHFDTLAHLGYQVQSRSSRSDAITLFQNVQSQIVYFYCHGVLSGTSPGIRINTNATSDYFAPDSFREGNLDIDWSATRPLVFINGCHTTALSPEQALNFVQPLFEDQAVAGVIGTEITVFEELAQFFAQTFLQEFRQGKPLGRAFRETRLALLEQSNPLGLVYDPYAYAGLVLAARS